MININSPNKEKEKLRKELKQKIEEFLNSGGRIKELDICTRNKNQINNEILKDGKDTN